MFGVEFLNKHLFEDFIEDRFYGMELRTIGLKVFKFGRSLF